MAKKKTVSKKKVTLKAAKRKGQVVKKAAIKKSAAVKRKLSSAKKSAPVKKKAAQVKKSSLLKRKAAAKKLKTLKVKSGLKKSLAKSGLKKKVAGKIAARKVAKKRVKAVIIRRTVAKKVSDRVSASQQKPVAVPSPRKYKPNKKVRYTKSELNYFKEIILKERKAIFESARANMDALVDKESGEYKGDDLTYSSHMAEQGSDEMEREKNYLFVQRDEKYLGYLQEALMRIDQGTFGICVDCKDHPKNLCRTCPLIAKERLELVPITQHCIECKNLRG